MLVLSAGNEMYRRYILESMSDAGVRVDLIESPPQRNWAVPLVDSVHEVDLGNREQVRALAKELHAADPFDGVLTYDETRVEVASEVAADLGLPGLSPQTAAMCRDKRLMREAFRAVGVPSARSILALTAEEAVEAAALIGYPVVVKPRNLGGSRGVVRVEDEQQLRSRFELAASARDARVTALPGVLVEEYLDGPEISVEAVSQDGRVQICGLTEKEVGFAPYFEELGHTCRRPSAHPDYSAVERVVVEAHRALGITFGATHSELRLTSSGPRMIEVAARLAGDKIPFVTSLATGVNLVALTVASLTGEPVEVTPTHDRVAGIRMVYPRHDGTVRALGHAADAERLWCELGWHVTVGQEVALPPRAFMLRLGHVVALDSSPEALRGRLDACVDALEIEIESPVGLPGL
nr:MULTISPECIES: ATP-grasp domain-containing protein [unclassified Streptomyces]